MRLMSKLGKCDWCGVGLEDEDGVRLLKPARNMGAAFCRLEHVVPWLMKKNDWHILGPTEIPDSATPTCSVTGEDLDESSIYLVRWPSGVEVADGFQDSDALLEWARSGGRYAPG